MSDYSVTGTDLKKMVGVARKKPLNFAFNPGKSPKDHMLGLDRRKDAEIVARSVKKNGPSGKVAFGALEVAGNVASVTCTEVLPGMAKKMKAFFKANDLTLKVRVLDATGTLVEDDGEDEDDAAPAAEPAEPGEAEPDPKAELLTRIKAVQPLIMQTEEALKGKLVAAIQKVGEAIKSGNFDPASEALTKIEQAVKGAASDASAPPDDGRLSKLREASEKLKNSIGAVSDETARGKLMTAAGQLDGFIEAQEVEKSLTAIKTIQAALQKVAGAPAAEPAMPSEAADEGGTSEEGIAPLIRSAEASVKTYATAVEQVDKQISGLQVELRNAEDPELLEIADKGLNAITSGFKTKVQAAIMDFNRGGDGQHAAAGKLADLADDYLDFLTSDERVEAVDMNPSDVSVNVRGTMGPALERLIKTMGKVAKAGGN